MASTPSASALSAVVRCRGNIWARNPPTKRPASAGYSLGLAAGARRDPPADFNRPNRPSAWEVGERAAAGGRLTVTCASPQADGQLSLVRTGLKSPRVSLTALLSHFMCVRLLVGTRSDDVTLSPTGGEEPQRRPPAGKWTDPQLHICHLL
ncbi:unnamed protein product [Pleuronectes platessa]|uniref:Uncharacterized protein n=1 Tax=Pleuronectes platessa TaxID=8262 RepID=A0A9N7Z7L9_PLEPL|nr:unnamed protein product [Pleuronectes platessa]